MSLYNFSFGSNMSSHRLLARLPNAKRIGTAVLQGYELTFDMYFKDGSGKCSISPSDAEDALV
ncbi:gamma-glutamylcyclotransferase family protein, partial [Pseudoalteromonas sp. GW168-MNA-CIBAN-0100]